MRKLKTVILCELCLFLVIIHDVVQDENHNFNIKSYTSHPEKVAYFLGYTHYFTSGRICIYCYFNLFTL